MAKIFFEKLIPNICDIIPPPRPAVVAAPKWWKQMEKFNYEKESSFPNGFPHKDYATIRSCPSLNDSINFGYVICTPADIFIDASNEDRVEWFLPETNFSIMENGSNDFFSFTDKENFINFKFPEEYHHVILRMNTFYGIKTQAGYSCWITTPVNNATLPFKILDAIVDTDEYPARFPYSFLIKRGFKGVIKAGTPFIQVVPFKREDFVSEIIDFDPQEINRQRQKIDSGFFSSYKRFFWKRKKFL